MQNDTIRHFFGIIVLVAMVILMAFQFNDRQKNTEEWFEIRPKKPYLHVYDQRNIENVLESVGDWFAGVIQNPKPNEWVPVLSGNVFVTTLKITVLNENGIEIYSQIIELNRPYRTEDSLEFKIPKEINRNHIVLWTVTFFQFNQNEIQFDVGSPYKRPLKITEWILNYDGERMMRSQLLK